MNTHRLTSRYLATCFGVTTMVVGASCSHSEESNVPPVVTINRQNPDADVIETALVDLAMSSNKESETFRREQGKGRLLFSGKSRELVGTLRQELQSAESEAWKSLGSTDRNAAKRAAAEIIDRVESKQYCAAFHPKDPHILLWEDDPASTQPAKPFEERYEKPRPIHAAPPGYSDQGRLAVVVFSFPWSMHSGDVTYVLRFDGKKWQVISRHFTYYV
jgi:hypothetical protein